MTLLTSGSVSTDRLYTSLLARPLQSAPGLSSPTHFFKPARSSVKPSGWSVVWAQRAAPARSRTAQDSPTPPHPATLGAASRAFRREARSPAKSASRGPLPPRDPHRPKRSGAEFPPVTDNAESDSEGPARGAKRLIASSNRRAANLPGGRTECPSPRTLPPASGCGRRPSQIPARLRPLDGDFRAGRRPRRQRGRRACARGRQRRDPSAEDPHAGGPRRCP